MSGSFHCVIAGGAMGFIIFLLTRLIILYRAGPLGILPDSGQQFVQAVKACTEILGLPNLYRLQTGSVIHAGT
jgi:hypothetical protein